MIKKLRPPKKLFRPISIEQSVADKFAMFARDHGFTVSNAAEKALLYWMKVGAANEMMQFLQKPSVIEERKKDRMYMDMVHDEIHEILTGNIHS